MSGIMQKLRNWECIVGRRRIDCYYVHSRKNYGTVHSHMRRFGFGITIAALKFNLGSSLNY